MSMVAEEHGNGRGNMVHSDLDVDLALGTELESDDSTDDESLSSEKSGSEYHPALLEQPDEEHRAFQALSRPVAGSYHSVSRRQIDKMETAERPLSNRRLSLLDLPVDILKEIIKEITHMNDLASLALTCSALHSLAIPHIYSRFDIVWPDTTAASDHPTGVDALSYGLATLVMGEGVFSESPLQPRLSSSAGCCSHCGCDTRHHQATLLRSPKADRGQKLRRGNYYAQYTRKFSVGNGPFVWVHEYSITKETGKMLGTLVALAVARMVNLESFIWDMPTGVLRDVWTALASLADRPGHECRLERVWVRWHDNSENRTSRAISPAAMPMQSIFPALSLSHRYSHVEYPTFSVLPPLKSLSVLDIDEPSYLEEMGVLIERSRDRLRELRIGIACKPPLPDWSQALDDRPTEQDALESTTPGWPRFGGVLSILLSKASNGREIPLDKDRNGKTQVISSKSTSMTTQNSDGASTVIGVQSLEQVHVSTEFTQSVSHLDMEQPPSSLLENMSLEDRNLVPATVAHMGDVVEQSAGPSVEESKSQPLSYSTTNAASVAKSSPSDASWQDQKLKLDILELEEVALSIPVILRALDWRLLTTLTILRCENNEHLWRALRRQYSPSDSTHHVSESHQQHDSSRERKELFRGDYPLKIKHLHTDVVSPYLILFLKEAIAPNSLESIFLQECTMYESFVPIEAIYHHVIRRQRASLKKILIDSTRRPQLDMRSVNFHKWMFTREMLSFVTSGRMPQLRELGMAIGYKDWHFFLQRLPYVSRLRALYLPHIDDRALRNNMEPKELALQILDVVTLRPEIKICYIGMETKCFEILESETKGKRDSFDDVDGSQDDGAAGSDDGNDAPEVNDDEQDAEGPGSGDNHDDIYSGTSSLGGDDYSDEDEKNGLGFNKSKITFKLREILFYDDKISIFKARHGKI